jgi:valyl-tRNA synthetase
VKPQLAANRSVKKEGVFSIFISPLNVTNALHMGHALTTALHDIMALRTRMHGKTDVWIPGCDHAGIAAESVVENMLWRQYCSKRPDMI